jgi:hypothetical protein
MVSVLPSARSGMDVLGAYLGQGASAAMPQMYENQKFQRGMNAIDQLQAAMKPNAEGRVDQGQMLANIARAVAANPGLERSGLVEYAMKQAQALNQQNVPLPNAEGMQRDRSGMAPAPMRQEMPSFLNQPQQENKFFPTNIGPQGGTGNAPQEATSGQKIAIKTPQDIARESPAYAKQLTDNGIPTTPREAYEILKDQNADAKKHNEEVDKELGQRVGAQEKYGKRASDLLSNAYAGASPEMLSIAKKWGEDISKEGKSEAEIERYLVDKAKNLANSITNVKKSMSAPRVFDKIERAMSGDYKSFEQGANEVRNHLKPILDLGLYDESRKMLQDLGYGKEEREMIINPLSERAKINLNSLPKAHAKDSPETKQENLQQALIKLKAAEPNFSPLLARKFAEDRGYDWNDFLGAWNNLVESGFNLEDDQRNQQGNLGTPPLNLLDKILHTMDIIGR